MALLAGTTTVYVPGVPKSVKPPGRVMGDDCASARPTVEIAGAAQMAPPARRPRLTRSRRARGARCDSELMFLVSPDNQVARADAHQSGAPGGSYQHAPTDQGAS